MVAYISRIIMQAIPSRVIGGGKWIRKERGQLCHGRLLQWLGRLGEGRGTGGRKEMSLDIRLGGRSLLNVRGHCTPN